MAETIILPKLGNTVESAIILAWHVAVGDTVSAGDLLCEIETDKATLEIESTASGVLLAQLCLAGDEAPVMSHIAVVGEPGESIEESLPVSLSASAEYPGQSHLVLADSDLDHEPHSPSLTRRMSATERAGKGRAVGLKDDVAISPRALNLARRKGIDYEILVGSGPGGRIIERDIEAALRERLKVTPVAQAMLASGEFELAAQPPQDRRVTKADLAPVAAEPGVTRIPLKGVRKTIAKRMLASLQTTAQLTLNRSADARALLALRRRLKDSGAALGLREVNINDLLLFAIARTLSSFPALNALFADDIITQHEAVHLALAVDTERGLLVPVIRNADTLSLKQISAEAKRLAEACRAGKAQPDDLSGGTVTVSNLGALGIEHFTPLLNPPQVAILGIGSINLKPMQVDDEVEFIPHIGLSLTINHQVVDGAPAARFLQQLSVNLAQIDLLVVT